MTRIIAGSAKGRRLRVPSAGTRPTADKVREALFSILGHSGHVTDAAVLDLFAGSGAVAFEAISRGAERAVLVEEARPAARIASANAADLGFDGHAEVVVSDAIRFLRRTEAAAFDLVYADPPYAYPDADLVTMLDLLGNGWLAEDALVVVERALRSVEPAAPAGWSVEPRRDYGDTTLWFVRPPS